MRAQLVELNYPEHGKGITLPRIVLVMEMYPDYFNGIDIKEYLKTKDVPSSYRAFRYGKIPHRGMTTISFPNLNKKADYPYPRLTLLDRVVKSLDKSHKTPAY